MEKLEEFLKNELNFLDIFKNEIVDDFFWIFYLNCEKKKDLNELLINVLKF